MPAAAKKSILTDNIFWKSDSKPGAPVAAPAKPAPTTVTTTVTTTTTAAGQVDEGIKADLIKTMAEVHPAGYTYLEFMDSLKNMESIVPVEEARFKAAYAAVKSMITPANLVKTAQGYIDALQKNLSEFNSYLEDETRKRVTVREDNAKKSDSTIDSIKQQIDALTQQISKLQTDRVTLLNEAAAEKAKVDKLSANFKTTWDSVTQGISADIKKIQTYLGV